MFVVIFKGIVVGMVIFVPVSFKEIVVVVVLRIALAFSKSPTDEFVKLLMKGVTLGVIEGLTERVSVSVIFFRK